MLKSNTSKTFIHLQNSEISKRILVFSLYILMGVFIGRLILTFSVPKVVALIVGMVLLGFSIYKIEIPFYTFVVLLTTLGEANPNESSIFAYLTNANYPGIPSLLEMLMGLLILSFVVKLFFQRGKVIATPLNLNMMIFFSLLALSLFIGLQNGADRILLKEDFMKFLLPVLFFICSINILDSPKKITLTIVLIFAIAFIKSCLGIVYYFTGFGFHYGEGTVVFLETSDHIIFVTCILVFISLAIHRRLSGSRLVLILLATCPMLFSLIFSYRRNAWLGLLLSLVVLFWLVRGSRKLKMLVSGMCSALIVVLMISFFTLTGSLPSGEFLTSRFHSIFDRQESSNVAHFTEWVITFEDTMKHPIMGLGLGSKHRIVPEFPTLTTHTVHNAFLMLWMKMGIFAVLLFLWCLIRYFKFGIHNIKTEEDFRLKPLQVALFSSFGYWAVSLNVGASWFSYRETCLMALVSSLVLILSKTRYLDHNYTDIISSQSAG